ncbi:hypothetical protein BDF14DRAFT_1830869 [Spinellus fusiger]|nr:hypothetical protein BDF14DRAFT_1830869 [Spinellus fusiger]
MSTDIGFTWLVNHGDASFIFSWEYAKNVLASNFCSTFHFIKSETFLETIQTYIAHPDLIVKCYLATDPLFTGLLAVVVFSTIHYIVSEITKNYSQVDKAWSILPPVYAWHFALHDYLNRGYFHPRLLTAAIMITVWGTRLTYNFARKGGYEWHGQDYRYPYILSKIGPFCMAIVNITFIAPAQNLLLFLFVVPLYFTSVTGLSEQTPTLTTIDLVAVGLHSFFLLFETVADDQQFVFQTKKYAILEYVDRSKLTGDYKRGFLSESGLWKYTRHPNLFAEMNMWWSIYLFAVAAVHQAGGMTSAMDYCNWAAAGAISLTLLFQTTAFITEYISAEKYPEYKEYQRNVCKIIPWCVKRRTTVESNKKNKSL